MNLIGAITSKDRSIGSMLRLAFDFFSIAHQFRPASSIRYSELDWTEVFGSARLADMDCAYKDFPNGHTQSLLQGRRA
jgi:hypothetical protein